MKRCTSWNQYRKSTCWSLETCSIRQQAKDSWICNNLDMFWNKNRNYELQKVEVSFLTFEIISVCEQEWGCYTLQKRQVDEWPVKQPGIKVETGREHLSGKLSCSETWTLFGRNTWGLDRKWGKCPLLGIVSLAVLHRERDSIRRKQSGETMESRSSHSQLWLFTLTATLIKFHHGKMDVHFVCNP